MSKKIPVILLEDVEGIGKAGEVVQVAEGFARNSLFSAGKAALAEAPEGKAALNKREQKKAQQEQELTVMRELAEKLEGTELAIEGKVNEGDELFGSIKAADIATQLNTQAHTSVKPRQVKLETPIKQLGTYDVLIALSSEVEFVLKVIVTPSQDIT